MTFRVLHVDTEFGWRGGERQVLWLSSELVRRGHDSLIAARPSEPLARQARAAGLRVLSCAPFSELDPIAAWALRRLIARHRVQVVHAHTAHALGLTALATLGTRVAVVAARRVDFPLRANAITRWKYQRAHAVIAVSRAVARVLADAGVDPAKITVISDGIDPERAVTPATRDLLDALAPGAGPLVLQVSQLVPHKDPVNFVRAMSRVRASVPAARGLLVGEGPLRPEVEREIETLGLTNTVRLAGYRTDAESLVAAADVVCLSSREEGMGSVLLDALARGVAVAATTAGGIPDLVVDGGCGLLAPPRDPALLGDAITRLLEDHALRERLRCAGQARVREFSMTRLADRTLEVYERAVAATG